MEKFLALFQLTGFAQVNWQMPVMWLVSLTLLYLAVYRGFEPLLLVPIGFGALLSNLPAPSLTTEPAGAIISPLDGVLVSWHVSAGEQTREGQMLAMLKSDVSELGDEIPLRARTHGKVIELICSPQDQIRAGQILGQIYSKEPGGFYYYISRGIEWEIFPPLIFLGVGALTDFGPLIARPVTLLVGAAAQIGVGLTFLVANFLGFSLREGAAIAIIGGADGPTAIFLASQLAPHLLSTIAVAAYSYMALVPLIQPPIMRALTSPAERLIRMESLRHVSKFEKLVFILVVTVFCILLVPAAAPLIGMLMLGNFFRECGVTERLVKASQNEIINIVTIFLGTSVGVMMTAERFLRIETLLIVGLGVVAFGFSTAGGILMVKFLNLFLTKKINPLIGSAGVSAVPMAARVSHVEGLRADPQNFLLMHAMGPNVAGVIGTAIIAGFYLAWLK